MQAQFSRYDQGEGLVDTAEPLDNYNQSKRKCCKTLRGDFPRLRAIFKNNVVVHPDFGIWWLRVQACQSYTAKIREHKIIFE